MDVLRRFLSYRGSLEFQALNDEEVESSYQHKFIVQQYAPYIKNKRVLDAGCWTGPIARTISDAGIETELIGLDENKSALSIAKKNFPKFNFLQCKLTDPDLSLSAKYRGYFDSVIFLDVMEHLPSGCEVKVLNFLRSLLKTNGVLVMSTMADHILNIIDPAWMRGHRHYKLKTIRDMLQDSGFEVSEVLKIGNLWWDIDLLYFYIFKHLLKKKYQTSIAMKKRIMQGFNNPIIPTRFYVLAKAL